MELAHQNFDEALGLLKYSLELCELGSTVEEMRCAGESLDYIGFCVQQYYLDAEKAADYYKKAEDKYALAGTEEQKKDLQEARGILSLLHGDLDSVEPELHYKKAGQAFHEILDFRRKHFDSPNHPEICDALANLGIYNDQIGAHGIASTYFDEWRECRGQVDGHLYRIGACNVDMLSYVSITLLWHHRNLYFRDNTTAAFKGLECIANDSNLCGTMIAAHAAMCLGDLARASARLAESGSWYNISLRQLQGAHSDALIDSVSIRMDTLDRPLARRMICRWGSSQLLASGANRIESK